MKFLLAFDGSPSGQHALEKAIHLTRSTDGELILMTAIEPMQSVSPPNAITPTGDPTIDWQNAADKDWQADLEKVINEQHSRLQQIGESMLSTAVKQCEEANIKHKTLIAIGVPRDEIVDTAEKEKPDVLIIGSRGHGPIKRLLLGSVSDYVVHHAHCSVLIVRPEDD